MGNGASIEPYEGNELEAPVSARVVEKQGESTGQTDQYVASKKTAIVEEEKDDSLTEVLFQFIPFYGQGDPTNDSTVRASLSCLSIEDIDSRDSYGNTLLILACTYRCEDLARIMLNKGADPNAVNSVGAGGLHFACYGESLSIPIVKGLLQYGANPEVAEATYGCTPLHYAASTGNVELCKLLLSHGAVINTVDYYNYTCVDYARQAGMADAAVILQQKLDQHHMQFQYRGGGAAMMMHSPQPVFSRHGNAAVPSFNVGDWSSLTDPSSGHVYYVNNITGETLWEHDWKERQRVESSNLSTNASSSSSSSAYALSSQGQDADSGSAEKAKKKKVVINVQAKTDAWLTAKAMKTRLIAFFGKHDPIRLPDIDNLLKENKGRELEMVKELCQKYNVPEETEIAAFKTKYAEVKKESAEQERQQEEAKAPASTGNSFSLMGAMKSMISGGAGGELRPSSSHGPVAADAKGIDSLQLQNMVNEERAKLETKLNQERDNYKIMISEKDGMIAKGSADIEAVKRETNRLSADIKSMMHRLKSSTDHGDQVMAHARDELQLQKKQLERVRGNLEQERSGAEAKNAILQQLEEQLSTLTAGNEERIAQEHAIALQREQATKELDHRRRAEIAQLEEKKKAMETKAKAEIGKLRSDHKRAEEEQMSVFNKLKKGLEIEIDSLSRELADIKSRYAKEITAANITAENCKKVCEEAVRRMKVAEDLANSMEAEVEEAKIVAGFNAQLTKDLGREQLTRKKLHNEMEDMKGKIRVYVRVRPLSKSEIEKQCTVAAIKDSKTSIVVKNPDGSVNKTFEFDQVFAGKEGNSQEDIFRDTKHLVMSVLDGFNVCIFAYGQTGAGKSYTMIGAADIGNCMRENGDFDNSAGITPRAVSELFRLLNERSAQMTYIVEVQMFQLYRDNIDDLLLERKRKGKKGDDEIALPGTLKIILAEHSSTGLVQVEGAEILSAETPGDVMRIFAKGSARRTTASTQMNAESSRSHLICSLVVKMTNKRSGTVSVGKLTLVDLAGSERVDKSGAMGEVLKEAQSINKSLSALGDVIAALTSGQQHIPYRNHPLTMLMSDSVGGNSKTLIFINASPADYNSSETISSLGFGTRCKDITNSVQAGPQVQAAQLAALKKELAKLKKGSAPVPSSKLVGLNRPV